MMLGKLPVAECSGTNCDKPYSRSSLYINYIIFCVLLFNFIYFFCILISCRVLKSRPCYFALGSILICGILQTSSSACLLYRQDDSSVS